jgi:putative endopeptidase
VKYRSILGCMLVTVACQKQKATERPQSSASIPRDVAAEVLANLDENTAPCDDFYRYACGGWLDATQLPPEEPRYGRFHVLRDRNKEVMRDVLERAAANGSDDKLGKFWNACMDESAVESRGLADLQPALKDIDSVRDADSMLRIAGTLQRRGVQVLFEIAVDPDYKKPEVYIPYLGQGGLGLPDREFYLSTDARMLKLREGYLDHVARMLELSGMPAVAARTAAADVVALEGRLAALAVPREDLREPERRYNKLDRQALATAAPLPWDDYFTGLGRADVGEVSLAPKEYFVGLAAEVKQTPIATWRAYLRWQLVHTSADQLPSAFVDENFAFFGKALKGQQALAPRWKRCVDVADVSLGELLGRGFVDARFSPTSKNAALEMITQIEHAFAAGLPKLAWMDEGTRTAAVGKMQAIVNKIGYPDAWKDYGALAIGDDHLANVAAAASFELDRQVRQIGGKVDQGEWEMTPPAVNAYYNASGNEMVFPAGILQPPFFREDWPLAMNMGGIGMVMGHELTHGFDDQGRKFDGEGTLRVWWAPEVGTRFEERAACVEGLYSSYEVQPGVHLSGKLTLGENIADLGGIKEAHRAFLSAAQAQGLDPKSEAAPGLTHEQLFFVSFGQIWCTKSTPENDQLMALTDSHSHPRYRVNGPLANLPEFATAFSCQPGTKMSPADQCEVW